MKVEQITSLRTLQISFFLAPFYMLNNIGRLMFTCVKLWEKDIVFIYFDNMLMRVTGFLYMCQGIIWICKTFFSTIDSTFCFTYS